MKYYKNPQQECETKTARETVEEWFVMPTEMTMLDDLGELN